ncbi:MAG: hypothetical protein ABIB41_05045 [Nitrospirota bacterium]
MEKRSISFFLLIFGFFSLMGCATGVGINQHQMFNDISKPVLPINIVVDEKSRSIESGAIMTDSSVMLLFGLGGAAVSSTPGAVGAIRGKFAAGEVFEQAAKSISTASAGNKHVKVQLQLLHFQQYLVGGKKRGLEAIMKFKAQFVGTDKITLSTYAFHWNNKGASLFPGTEKDILREMIEYALMHWAQMFLNQNMSNASIANVIADFPPASRGQFSGRDVECSYEIFVKQ